jgi:DNA-binding response OmpR family regulator
MKPADDLILLIDDNMDLLNVVAVALGRAGYRVLLATDGATGLEMFRLHSPNLVILDIMMPGIDGWEVCRQLREISDVPIIMLTVLGQERDIVRGLREGADDYIPKPFSSRELLSRIEAVLRRVKVVKRRADRQNLIVGDLVLDLESHQVVVKNRTVKLTPIEFCLLIALAEQVGKVVPHRQLLCQVWGEAYTDDVRQLKVYIHYLRQKLEDDPGNPRYILSERGEGYRLAV